MLVMALPQTLLRSNPPPWMTKWVLRIAAWPWPHTLTTRLATGDVSPFAWVGMAAWMLGAYAAARFLFERNLQLDEEEARAGRHAGTASRSLSDRLFRLPARLLPEYYRIQPALMFLPFILILFFQNIGQFRSDIRNTQIVHFLLVRL